MHELDEVIVGSCDACPPKFEWCGVCKGTRVRAVPFHRVLGHHGFKAAPEAYELLAAHADLLQLRGHRVGHFLARWLTGELWRHNDQRETNEQRELVSMLEWRHPPRVPGPTSPQRALYAMDALYTCCTIGDVGSFRRFVRTMPALLRNWLGLVIDLSPVEVQELVGDERFTILVEAGDRPMFGLQVSVDGRHFEFVETTNTGRFRDSWRVAGDGPKWWVDRPLARGTWRMDGDGPSDTWWERSRLNRGTRG
jgi:hypothetical protein